ncbi:MAG: 23S rRNA (pseudouridine(1915)-N(3))-methyltransferase RlmH, partial [Clostridia bacterium]|nr:23S rRNA (pseudouridine(1915)-N(3))-methyltransferase RlmH [Clostridia bacterium]
MNGVILCVGKLKEKWQQQGCAEYLKRLSRYGKYEIVAVDDEREPEHPSEALIRQIKDREGA